MGVRAYASTGTLRRGLSSKVMLAHPQISFVCTFLSLLLSAAWTYGNGAHSNGIGRNIWHLFLEFDGLFVFLFVFFITSRRNLGAAMLFFPFSILTTLSQLLLFETADSIISTTTPHISRTTRQFLGSGWARNNVIAREKRAFITKGGGYIAFGFTDREMLLHDMIILVEIVLLKSNSRIPCTKRFSCFFLTEVAFCG